MTLLISEAQADEWLYKEAEEYCRREANIYHAVAEDVENNGVPGAWNHQLLSVLRASGARIENDKIVVDQESLAETIAYLLTPVIVQGHSPDEAYLDVYHWCIKVTDRNLARIPIDDVD